MGDSQISCLGLPAGVAAEFPHVIHLIHQHAFPGCQLRILVLLHLLAFSRRLVCVCDHLLLFRSESVSC